MSRRAILALFLLYGALTRPGAAAGQSSFEIQVYGSETVAPRTTTVELHSNVAADGSRRTVDHLLRTQGQPDRTWEQPSRHRR